jgi:ABC-2 type transport system permease protein
LYPQFETENAAQVPTSFGGLLFMMASVVMIGAVVILEATPVYSYLSAGMYNTDPDRTQMLLGFGLAALVCVGCTLFPIRIALSRLSAVER